MMRSNKFYIVTATILMLLMIAAPSFAQKDAARIRLGKFKFAPTRGEKPKIPHALAIRGYQKGVRGYYIIQFPGPIQEAWKKQATEAGAEILDYIPDFAFKVRMTPEEAFEVKELANVTWVGLYQPAYKLSTDLKRNGTHMYTVRLEQSGDVASARAAIAKSGAKVVRHKGNILKVTADSTQLEAIARVLDVAWIQNFMMWEKHNEYAAGEILGGSTAESNGYDGTDQIIAIADTGLGGGTEDTAHLDLPQSRIKAIHIWTRAHVPQCIDFFCYCVEEILSNGAEDRNSGHGTHTTLSALGGGYPSSEEEGTAPGAQLIFQAVEDFVNYYPGPGYEGSIDTEFCEWLYDVQAGYYLSGIPNNIAELFQQAYNEDARIHSNSWGSNAMGAYTVDSRNADEFIWNLPDMDMTITYSAGNSGTDGNGDGVIDSDSIGSPATAKNVITVGASENQRGDNYPCDDTLEMGRCDGDNEDLFTYGQAWPGNFPANPINGDPVAGKEEQMAAFSSRGPTDDGRIKPDLVAPGTFVLSGYSDLYQEGYDPSPNPQNSAWQYDGWSEPYSEYYKYMGGTSMSSPLVAGAAAVVRDFYQETEGHSASAALVKATLINSAHDLLDENNDGADDNDFPIPNVHEGWGRVDLANATDGSHLYVDDTVGLHTAGMSTYNYSVVSNGSFKVTLVWSDYPSATGVSKNLVNDLDLKVTSPQGTIYFGNVFSGGWSVTGGAEDRLNNVENVYVQSPEEGTWTIEVKGFNVPYGPQPFALVVDGTFVQVNTPPVAVDDTFSTVYDTVLNVAAPGVLGNDSDDDGDVLTAVLQTGPTNGTLTLNSDGSFTYTPNRGFVGTDSFTYVANDGATDSNVATVTINVTNQAPVANDDAASTAFETPATIDVLANDTDVDDDVLSINSFDAASVAGGTVNCTATATCLYTPPPDFNGTDTFTYDNTDGINVSNRATVTVTVGAAPNISPVAVDDAFTTVHDTVLNVAAPGVLGNDSDDDDDPLTAVLVADVANGALTLYADGSFTYTPNTLFTDIDTFTYQADDGLDLSNVATVTIDVTNAVPVANDDTATTDEDIAVNIDVLANDTDVDDDVLSINSFDAASVAGGTVNCTATATCLYTPPADFNGTDTFTYDATDGIDVSNRATVTVTVTAPLDTMHLDTLSVKTKAGRWFWRMKVTATVQDGDQNPVANATVRYRWSDTPNTIYADCVTGASGTCTVAGYQFRGTCLTFTVVDVLHNTLTYDPDQNNVNDISACK